MSTSDESDLGGGAGVQGRSGYGTVPGRGVPAGAGASAGRGASPAGAAGPSGYGIVPGQARAARACASSGYGVVPGAAGVPEAAASGYGIMPGAERAAVPSRPPAPPSAPAGAAGLEAAGPQPGGVRSAPPGTGAEYAPGGAAQKEPPEVWERAVAAFQAWMGRRPGLVRALARLTRVVQVVTLVLLVAALLLVPRLAVAMVPAVFMVGCLLVMVLLARTRTVGVRLLSLVLGLSTAWALVVALATREVAQAVGLTVQDDGARIALAAFVEEPGKLVPLLVVALVAPGRVRRLAAVDWGLLGFAAGAGFTAAEDAVRRLAPPTFLEQVVGEQRLEYSLNPWAAGSFTVPESGLLGYVLGPELDPGTGPMAVGHQVWTMGVAMAVGLGLVLWRARRPWWRVLAWVLPAAVLTLAMVDHAGYNAAVQWLDWAEEGSSVPGWIGWLWLRAGRGHAQVRLSVVLLVVCLLVDAYRRYRAAAVGTTVAWAPRVAVPPMVGVPALVRLPVQSLVALAAFSWSDLVLVRSAYGAVGLTRRQRMAEGRATANQVRGVRGDAMAATVPGREPLARNVFRVVALVVGAAVLLGCLWYGTTVAREIGASLRSADDWFFFAGLLEVLGDFWDELGPGGQILLTAVAVGLLGMAGMSLALALGVTGVATWAMSHGRGLSAFVRDPVEATRSYARTFTLEQLALDALDFGLTFIPGSALSAGTRSAARSLASSRAAMARAEDLGEMLTHFQRHAELDAALRAAQARLGSMMPPGYTARDFTKNRLGRTIDRLRDAGYTDEQINALKYTAKDVTSLRGARNRAAEYVGERGGEQVLTREGYYIPQSFRSTGPHRAGPGRYAVDSMAVSPSGDQIVIPEIKGGSSTVSTKPVQTLHEGYASQATPPYVRDRMLRDQRVVQFFRDNPALWESVKRGDTRLSLEVISSPSPGSVVRSHQMDFSLTPEVIQDMEARMARL